MYSYKISPRFDPRTGKPTNSEKVIDKLICDYSGEVIPEHLDYEVKIEQIGGSEETWYYDDEREYFENLGIDYGSVFISSYHFLSNQDGHDFSAKLVEEWTQNFNNKKSIFHHCLNLDTAFRLTRIRTIKKLLKNKSYSIEELGFDVYEE